MPPFGQILHGCLEIQLVCIGNILHEIWFWNSLTLLVNSGCALDQQVSLNQRILATPYLCIFGSKESWEASDICINENQVKTGKL